MRTSIQLQSMSAERTLALLVSPSASEANVDNINIGFFSSRSGFSASSTSVSEPGASMTTSSRSASSGCAEERSTALAPAVSMRSPVAGGDRTRAEGRTRAVSGSRASASTNAEPASGWINYRVMADGSREGRDVLQSIGRPFRYDLEPP